MFQQSPTLTKRFFAVALIAAFALPCLTGCANNTPETESSTEATTETAQTTEAETESTTEAATEAPTQTAAVASTEATTEKDNTPKTKAEIAAYVNTAFAVTKRQAKSVTNTWKRGSNYQNVLDLGKLGTLLPQIQAIVQSVMDANMKTTEPNITYTGADIAANFPPANATASLSASAVQSASCTKRGNEYIIKITAKPETNPTPGKDSGAFCNLLTDKQITDPVPLSFDSVICDYYGTSCELHVDIATGRITYLYSSIPLILKVKPSGVTLTGKVGLQFEEKWTVQY